MVIMALVLFLAAQLVAQSAPWTRRERWMAEPSQPTGVVVVSALERSVLICPVMLFCCCTGSWNACRGGGGAARGRVLPTGAPAAAPSPAAALGPLIAAAPGSVLVGLVPEDVRPAVTCWARSSAPAWAICWVPILAGPIEAAELLGGDGR